MTAGVRLPSAFALSAGARVEPFGCNLSVWCAEVWKIKVRETQGRGSRPRSLPPAPITSHPRSHPWKLILFPAKGKICPVRAWVPLPKCQRAPDDLKHASHKGTKIYASDRRWNAECLFTRRVVSGPHSGLGTLQVPRNRPEIRTLKFLPQATHILVGHTSMSMQTPQEIDIMTKM